MKKLRLLVMALMLVGTAACAAPGSSTIVPPTMSTSIVSPGQEPVQVVSVTGPIPPINPGGPTVEITLKNISTHTFVSLQATLGINSATPKNPFTFNFDISDQNPLSKGKSVAERMTLIGGSFNNEDSYPLAIYGDFQDGAELVAFSYTVQVRVSPPASQTTVSSTVSSTTTTTTSSVVMPSAPVKVVSLVGPIPPINPGGPTVQLTLQNVSDQPIISLKAIIGVESAPPGRQYTFSFNVTSANPLPPGGSAVDQANLIGGSFNYDVAYPVVIDAGFKTMEEFFTVQARFLPSPGEMLTTSSMPPVTTTPGQEPVEIVAVIGGVPPINPGGPVFQVELRNVSSQPVVALAASLNPVPNGAGATFDFGISPENPLTPGEIAFARGGIIGPGPGDELTVTGALQDGSTFSYTTQVEVTSPPEGGPDG